MSARLICTRIAAATLLIAVLPPLLDFWLLPRTAVSSLPAVDDAEVWGDRGPDSAVPVPFTVAFPDEQIEDVRQRLRKTTSHGSMAHVMHGSYGIEPSDLNPLLHRWESAFDWRVHERHLNSIGLHFLIVDGLQVVFHHVRAPGRGSQRRAILLLHGWPGSIFEFHPMIEKLSAHQQSGGAASGFDLVVPCLPGYGFSSAPVKEGYDTLAMARTFHRLMSRLGYDRFVVHGGDWGSVVARLMGFYRPAPILGIHLNFFPVLPTPGYYVLEQLGVWLTDSDESRARAAVLRDLPTILGETGYFHEQATCPETLCIALSDSPAGLAAWVLEKFDRWSSRKVRLSEKFDPDTLLANVMLYWLTGSITSSMRLYKETASSQLVLGAAFVPVTVPVALSLFPDELFPPPDYVVRRHFRNLVLFRHHERGGHFAALEAPEALTADLIELLSTVNESLR
jgi:pimeloyl-ACP methyl ester carboxylesterase